MKPNYVHPHHRIAPDGNPFNYSYSGRFIPGDPLYLERYYNKKRHSLYYTEAEPTHIKTLDDQSDYTLVVQKALYELGYQVGTLDGILGPQTYNAIMDFQKDIGLTPDGIVGPETIAKLIEALVMKCQSV
jgi:hypothetical protein